MSGFVQLLTCFCSGQPLLIEATGTLREKVSAGAYVSLQVKYGVITLIKQTVDLCEQIKNVDLDCPIEGDIKFTKSVDLPREIPPVRTFVRI
jgi:hypothetical protein